MSTTLPGTGKVISSDPLNASTGLNGAAPATAEEVQRTKNTFGAAGFSRDVSPQFPLPVSTDGGRTVTFNGRAGGYRTPGRAGTTGQKLFSITNTSGSALLVDVERITVDAATTVVKAVTVLPPAIRIYRFTGTPTGGTTATKVAQDSAQSSSANVSVLGDASADGTSSASALTAAVTPGNFARQVFAPRLITAAGYEILDTFTFFDSDSSKITLRANESLVVVLDYVLATQNPTTDMWTIDVKWSEYTLA